MALNYGTFLSGRYYRVSMVLLMIVILKIVYDIRTTTNVTVTTSVDNRPQLYQKIPNKFEFKTMNISQYVNMVDLHEPSDEKIRCIKTKALLHNVRTTICLNDERDAVSNIIAKDKIWEEQYLTELLGFLIRYPNVHFIDAGANVGTYTMFMASFGRFVLSIECFKPNINRIRKAIQIEKLENNVVLVGNAISAEPGKYMKLKSDPFNVGSQAVIMGSDANDAVNDMYTVRTMHFDDILPILVNRNISSAIMKVDIQWSEIYLCQTGNKTFDAIDIPVVLMEWDVGAMHYERLRSVVNYFIGRGYVPTSDMCTVLKEGDALGAWPSDIYWMKMNRSEIC